MDVYRCLRMFQDVLGYLRMFKVVYVCFRLFMDVSDQDVSACLSLFMVVQDVSGCLWMFKDVSGCFIYI